MSQSNGGAPPTTDDVFARIDADQERYLEELEAYLRIPSVSTDPAHDADVERCSRYLADRLAAAGLRAERIETEGHPLVYAEHCEAPGKPTVLFYGHYDVQPPDPLDEWRHPPFEPTREGGQLLARGATDDKGQSYAHVKGVEAHLATRGALPVNVKFLVEGEEESGGEAIESYVREDGGKRLECDCVVVSDSSMFGPGQPSLLYGLKGLLYAELRVSGPARDLHSGTFGGAVRNPLNALAQILTGLRDPKSGRVEIPGFYDDVRPLEDWERQGFAALPFDEEAYRRDLGVDELFGEADYTTLERVWARPTLDVHGLFGGYQGPGSKTVLPREGGAKFSMRLVPDQDPERIFSSLERFVSELAPSGVRVALQKLAAAPPVLVDTSGPLANAALEAMADVWGKTPVRVREGGSIPIVSTFSDVLHVPVLLLGFGLPDDRLHAPNEKIEIANYFAGIRATARLLDRMSATTA